MQQSVIDFASLTPAQASYLFMAEFEKNCNLPLIELALNAQFRINTFQDAFFSRPLRTKC